MPIKGESFLLKDPPPRLGRIFFEGLDELDRDDLLERMAVEPRPWSVWSEPEEVDLRTVQDDIRRVENVYRRAGYYQARVERVEVEERPEGFVDLYFSVYEGEPLRVSRTVDLQYPEQTTPAVGLRAVNTLDRGDVFSEDNYFAAAERMREFLQNVGYYAAAVTPEAWLDPDAYSVSVTYVVFDGPRVRFGPIAVEGLQSVDESLVRRELEFQTGQWYQRRRVEATIDDLMGLNLFRSVRIEPRYPSAVSDPMPMVIRVIEGSAQNVRLGAGYGTEDQIRAQAIYQHYNLLGGGRRLRAALRVSAILQTADVTFVQPHVLSKYNLFSLSAGYRREERLDAYSFERFTLTPRMNRRINRRLTVFAGYLLEYNFAFDLLAPIPLEERRIVEPGLLSGPVLGAEWNSTDSLLFPTEGNVTRALFFYAGRWFGGEFDFYRWTLESRQYLQPARRWVTTLRIRVGSAEAVGSSRVPIYEKFYSGGDASIRGYRRDRLGPAIGGLTLVEGSLEARRRFRPQWWIAAFVDAGMVSLSPYDWAENQLRWGVGPGVLYESLVGLIHVYLGVPLQPRVDEPTWRLHLSIGQAF